MINKVAYDFENTRIDCGKAGEVDGITDIKYTDKVESEKIRGTGREAIDATDGTYEVDDGEMTLHWWAWQNLKEKLGPGFMRKTARFDISVSFSHEGEPVVTDVLQKCRVIGSGNEHSSKGALMVTVPIQIMKVLHGGIDPMTGAN